MLVSISLVASLLTIAAVVLAGSHQRSAQREADALRKRAAATVKRTAVAQAITTPAGRRTKICPRGAEGLGNTARRSIRRKLLGESGKLDLAALGEMSNLAIAAGRYLERARAAPALPQRLGRTRSPGADGKLRWKPIEVPTVGCALVTRQEETRVR